MRTLGVDEAGRGCVLGALFVAGFLVETQREASLWDAGAADSKALTPARRRAVRAEIEVLGLADVRRIEVSEIEAGNLNALEERAVADLVRTHRPDRVLVDALGHPSALPAILDRLRCATGPGGPSEWTMEPRADATHAAVAAASIVAKTERDAALDALRAEWGEIGTGYPSDPVTRAWLARWAATGQPWPPFVRTRWKTIAEIAQRPLF